MFVNDLQTSPRPLVPLANMCTSNSERESLTELCLPSSQQVEGGAASQTVSYHSASTVLLILRVM